MPFKCEFTAQAINDYIKSLKNQLSTDGNNSHILFKQHKFDTFLLNKVVMGLENAGLTVLDLYKDMYSSGDEPNKKKKLQVAVKPKVLNYDLLWKLTNYPDVKSKAEHAPVCILNKSIQSPHSTLQFSNYFNFRPNACIKYTSNG